MYCGFTFYGFRYGFFVLGFTLGFFVLGFTLMEKTKLQGWLGWGGVEGLQKIQICILVLRFWVFVLGFSLDFTIMQKNPNLKCRKCLPEGPRADFGLRPLKVSKQNCIGATILESPPKSVMLESLSK